MRVLVVYGTKRGGTEGLAAAVGQGLIDAGHTVEVLPAGKPIDSLMRWEAVVVGGAVCAWFWRCDARRFVKRHLEELQQLPVWFFSSGALDDSASKSEVPPPASVTHLARIAGVQAHTTFGGRTSPKAKTATAARGDWRDLPATRAWGRAVGEQLATMPVLERAHVPESMSLVHRLVLSLCLFTGVTAVGGGLMLITSPPRFQGPPSELLARAPFDSSLIPGLLLFLVIGLGNLAAAALEARRIRGSEVAVLFAGAALTTWIVTQLVMIRTVSWLQLVYLLIGAVTLGSALWLWRVRHRLAPHRLHPRT